MKAQNTSKQKRLKRAVLITLLVSVLLIVPFSLLFYMNNRSNTLERTKLGEVTEFIVKDTEGVHFSLFDLKGKITLLAYFPAGCEAACMPFASEVAVLGAWAKERLIYDFGSEVSPLKLVMLGSSPLGPPNKTWRHLEEPAAAAALLPTTADRSKPIFTVIDEHGRFRTLVEGTGMVEPLKPYLSKLTITYYMDDYLQKRTFFRRTPKPM